MLAGAASYANSLNGAFLFDDDFGIVRNGTLRAWWQLARVLSPPHESPLAGRPLPNASLALNFAVGGLAPGGYHIVNFGLHMACALLAFAVLRRTFESKPLARDTGDLATPLAFATCLIWTVHPLTSEVVDYTVQRTESMMACCLLLTLYASIRAGNDRKWMAAAVLACAAGMACKESMVVAPAIVVLYDMVFVFDSAADAIRARWPLYSGLCLTWGVLAVLLWNGPRSGSAGFGTAVSPLTYLLDQVPMLARYLRLAVWPDSLVLWYGPPQSITLHAVWPGAVAVVCVLLASIVAVARRHPLGFVGAWVFVTLAPTSSIVPIATEVGAERRMYLPLIALIALAVVATTRLAAFVGRSATSAADWPRLQSAALAGMLALAVIRLATWTVERNREYETPLGMAQTVLARWPTGGAHYMVGWELAQLGRHADALTEYRAAVDTFPRARYYLASELESAGSASEAVDQFRLFIRQQPDLAEVVPAQLKTGQALTQLQRFEEAFPYYRDYLSVQSQDIGALTDFGVALSQSGQHDKESLEVFQRAVALDPTSATLRANLARALFLSDDLRDASAEAETSLALNPNDPSTHDLLGRTLALEGRLDDARRQFEDSLRLDTADSEAREALEALRAVALARPASPRRR